jgi:general secretion pathway protein E
MRFADDAFGRLGMTVGASAPFREALAARLGEAPDALVAGEIRDRAGAEAAVRAASSRLVLAPIQAGHAVGAIARLRDHRIDPFTIAATLRLVIAQRLARRLCPQCREPVQASSNVSALLGFDPGTFVYVPRGCPGCEGSGYRGRIGLYEALPVEGAIRRLIGMDGDEAVIASHAFRDRPNLSGAARFMVRQGLIGAEEAVFLSHTPVRELV